MAAWTEIRYHCKRTTYGAEVVVLIHPWKGAWSIVMAEDMYGLSPILADRLSVKEAKAVAKALVKIVNRRFQNGCSVSYLESNDPEITGVVRKTVNAIGRSHICGGDDQPSS
jgi:hypothetical protein